jgi:hypothetical protein
VNVSNIVTGSGNGYGRIFSDVFVMYDLIDRLLVKKTLISSKSLSVMETYGKPDGTNQYGYGIMKKYNYRGYRCRIRTFRPGPGVFCQPVSFQK